MALPDRAIVLCADGKSQIQALDRTQPSGKPTSMSAAARPLQVDLGVMAQPGRVQVCGIDREVAAAGVRRSVSELKADIMSFIDAHDMKSTPFRWVKPSTEFLCRSGSSHQGERTRPERSCLMRT